MSEYTRKFNYRTPKHSLFCLLKLDMNFLIFGDTLHLSPIWLMTYNVSFLLNPLQPGVAFLKAKSSLMFSGGIEKQHRAVIG